MTGKIKSLQSPSGFITADNGLKLYFDAWAVLPDRGASLAVGQVVTFDLEGGTPLMAVNVRALAHPVIPRRTTRGHSESAQFQYVGFQHAGSVRAFRFLRVVQGEETLEFVVNADLALFAKYNVAIQEGPALSLHLLVSAAGVSAPQPMHSVTDQDMLAHLAKRPVPAARSGPKRNRAASGDKPAVG